MNQKYYASPVLVVIAGPTAVGKTDLCLKLARELHTDIISADSRQFYQEMNFGTAKPSPAELQMVKHYFINSHHITEEYSCGAFEADTLALLNELFREKSMVILTGGSGLYIQAVCEGLDDIPEALPAIRQQLITQLEQEGLPGLLKQLHELDPEYYQQVDRANPQRIIRALEVCYSSGQPYSSFRGSGARQRPFNIVKIGLTRDRAELYQRIDQRMDQMLAAGLAEEARQLYPYRAHNALQTVGYKEIFDFIEEKQDWTETVRLLKRNSRRYAKRQLTWFRRDPAFQWFHPDNWAGILAYIAQRTG
ncbi:tRNA dimethylallyltransferase 1 [Adhaeribacter aerolatus]|uniref:tRNA dimethylallyltransferase n=1 Tax=Adhaeribacter aerolatus TaxID=670289 RepID=A0A512AVE1_9BACT|nr:tRNA (adenosine(37)-N6)-dimethylallyltransferase MiaA [Adhaeribacter aerolatus]GEO03517.1 tRNA dimethylallyltransferase 1 [Adhaeribacter aerolatus]